MEAIDQQFVQAEIGNEDELVVGCRLNGVRVRTGLAVFIHAGSGMLHKSCARAECSIFLDREDGDAPSIVVGDEKVFAGAVDR